MNDLSAEQFETYRPLLFSIAYRMLGSATDAEDIVQETYLRYQTISPEQITSHKALLTTIVTRLCLDHLQSAHMQRETYIGPWLPEPVLTETNEHFAPVQQAELYDSLSIAFLTLLEELTPLERVVFLLREVFSYEYSEIAQIIDRKEMACRQLCSRAKRHIIEHRPRFKVSKETHRRILNEFIQATSAGDLDGLMQILSEDVIFWSDGGGKVYGAAIHPVSGRKPVAHFVLASAQRRENERVDLAEVNDEPAALLFVEGKLIGVVCITVDDEQICEIRAIGNPDKLKWVSRTLAERRTASR